MSKIILNFKFVISAKAGVCPDMTGMVGICVEACSEDTSCAGDKKCCSNGCGHVCMDPKPAFTTRMYKNRNTWKK